MPKPKPPLHECADRPHLPCPACLAAEKKVNRMQEIIEKILFRRGLEHKLEGYTLETSIEIAKALTTLTGDDHNA